MSSIERPGGLEGEDLTTTHWEDARHWIAIYADLLRFKTGLLDRVRRDIPGLLPAAQKAAAEDLGIIESQMSATRSASSSGTSACGSCRACASIPRGR